MGDSNNKNELSNTNGLPKQHVDPTSAARVNVFNELFEADKRRLYCYIYAFVSRSSDADDIFQETCLTLWREFDKFEVGTDFSKWANVIAFNRIRIFRRKQNKYSLGLSDDFLEELSSTLSAEENNSLLQEKKWRHLEQCCSQLSDPLRNIYDKFYVENLSAQTIADSTGRSIYAIRKAIHKLRKKLIDCVDSK